MVENPSILEEALARASTLPLACTSGQLRAVDHALFQLAVDQGVPLHYAGDLDNAGLQIAATVHQLYGAELVAMGATIVHTTRSTPSAIPIGALPPAHSSTELGHAHRRPHRHTRNTTQSSTASSPRRTRTLRLRRHMLRRTTRTVYRGARMAQLAPANRSPRERTRLTLIYAFRDEDDSWHGDPDAVVLEPLPGAGTLTIPLRNTGT
ncbi:hypothetical protein QF030_000103 [Streptomyces rishiriensis]|uniref:DUF2399 domain-containing protein n=1 Tax=Streptomyces rishiriensis TaxID=68264 RepID=A0ABU0NFQ2_STRRH|nr:hypothetical protein [Streptomyces rishiriensis]